jgi:predicted exporter
MPSADPLRRACARLVELLFRRRRTVLVVSALAFASMAAAAAQLRISRDWIEPFLPRSDAGLVAYAGALHRFGGTEALYVDVGADDPETLHASADLVETRMRTSALFTRVLGRLTESDLHRTAEAIGSSLPLLVDDDGLRDLDERTKPDAISARMEEHYERLLGPLGGWYQDSLARDPFDLAAMTLERAGGAGAGAGARIERGRLVSGDGRHALITGVALARVGDEAGGAAIEAFFGDLAAETSGARAGASLVWIGGHRHYGANSRAMQKDMAWVSILAVILVLAVISAGFRGARITWISALAVLVGAVAGAAALSIVYGECSGIALGFGAALSGISVDYVLHLHAARRSGESRTDAVRRVFVTVGPSVVIGAVTSAAGFLVLLASDVPAHGQLGVAAGAGIAGALLFALFPGPLLAAMGRRNDPAVLADPPNVFDRSATAMFGSILRRPRTAFALGAILAALGASAVTRLRFESDIRRFEVRDADVDGAQAAIASTWGDVFSQQLIVVPGADVETVLERTDALVAALRPFIGAELSGVASTSAVLPAIATQERRLATWRAFWTAERRVRVRSDLAAAASDFGIRTSTFDPFFASLDTAAEPLTPERLAETPLETVLDRHLSVRPGDVLGLIVVSGVARPPDPAVRAKWQERVRLSVPEARVLSGRELADAVVAATRHEFASLALPALLVVWLLLVAYYRGVVLASIGVFPLLGGLAVTAGLLVSCGAAVNLLNAAVALPVFGLGVDYAVFLMDAIRDAARDRPGDPAGRIHEVGMRMGTMIGDVLTTLAGAVAMMFAATPAIHSIGLAMTAGVGGAMVVAWLVVPQAMIWTGRVPK